ncbi:MAG: hypothetical protein B6242_14000 [Anaerolineaceae bacterium 4572_78]|nr:MAG: hypothetical protein B6242_14000 [Anaerolineaceae bacterium 4572_78]
MSGYVEYTLEDGSNVIFEYEDADESMGMSNVSRSSKDKPIPAKKKFEEALAGIKPWASSLREQLSDLKADEVNVSFGLKTTGEAGNFIIGKVGLEANYTVTLKWNNTENNQ